MPRIKLTKSAIDRLPSHKRDWYWDTDLKRFGIRVETSGNKYFIVQYKVAGRSQKVTLGQYPVLTPDEARKQALQTLGEVERGKNPALEKRRAKAPTLQELIETYIEKHVLRNRKSTTADEYRSILKNHFKQFKNRRVDDLSKRELYDYHHKLADTPRAANSAIQLWRAAFRWGCDYFDGMERLSDPSRAIRLYKRGKRDRLLSDDEVMRIGKAMDAVVESGAVSRSAVQAITFIAMTGMRNAEVRELMWADVDVQACAAQLRDSKTGPKRVPLGPDAMALLTGLQPLEGNDYVFAGRLKGQGFKDLQKPWTRICEQAGVEDATIHDLRHAFASRVGEQHKRAIADVLGHKTLSQTDDYRHSSPQQASEAAEIASSAIRKLLKPTTT